MQLTVKLNGKELLTQKDLAFRWGICLRAVRNERRRWKLKPITWIGLMPLFRPEDVEAAEARRHKKRSEQFA